MKYKDKDKEGINRTFAIFLGKQLREKRLKCRLTLMEVAAEIGISYQQIQKYESASSKISAQLLFRLANLYCTSVTQLFEGYKNSELFATNALQVTRSRFNILIVEDNPGDEEIARQALKGIEDLNLLCVHDADQTMKVLKYKTLCVEFPRPDLIFLDVFLPKRNGIGILKDIKKDKTFEDIPIVMVSNNVDSDLMLSAYKYGASGYICKTFDFLKFKESLVNCVKYWSNSVVLPSRVIRKNNDRKISAK